MFGTVFNINSEPVDPTPLTPEELKSAREVDNWMGGFMFITTIVFIAVVALALIFF